MSSVLALLGLSGFAYAAWGLAVDVGLAAKAAYAGFSLWFGASALLSAIGLWSMRRWALAPLSSWVLACLAAPWVPYLVAVNADDSLIDGIGSSVLMALVAVPVWLAARRTLRHRAPTPPGAA